MTALLHKSEMDAAQALLDLQGDPHYSSCDDTNQDNAGNRIMEPPDNFSIFGAFLASRTQLTPPRTPKKDNKIINTITKIANTGTQTTIYSSITSELEIRDQVIREMDAENELLKAKIKLIKDAHSRSSFSSSESIDDDLPRNPCKTRSRYVMTASTTDSTSQGDNNSTISRDLSNSKKISISPGNISKSLKIENEKTSKNDLVPIGEGNALVPSRVLKHMDWVSYTNATRKLLTAVFSRKVLATHSLTGKPSPAFPDKPAKKKLDSSIVNDIVQTVVEKCRVPENVVRTSITTKCADESKMYRTRKNKNKHNKSFRKENRFPSSD